MTLVVLTKKCTKELLLMKKNSLISDEELVIIRTWIREMENLGPDYIRSCGYWNDHSLRDKRSGERASSFSLSGRIIYKVKNNKVEVTIVKITPTHDYN